MKVADILDKITNAQGLADMIQDNLSRSEAEIRFDDEKGIIIKKGYAEDILDLILEYIAMLENKEVK